jgi:hypothetical protein
MKRGAAPPLGLGLPAYLVAFSVYLGFSGNPFGESPPFGETSALSTASAHTETHTHIHDELIAISAI